MTLPLEGFQMLDLSRLVPGPMATWMLADLGMDLLRIEDVSLFLNYSHSSRSRTSGSGTNCTPGSTVHDS